MAVHNWQGHFEDAFVTVKLCFALVLVDGVGQQFAEVEMGRLHNHWTIQNVKLDLGKLGVWQPYFDQDGVAMSAAGIAVRKAEEHVFSAHMLLLNDFILRRWPIIRFLFRLHIDLFLTPDVVFRIACKFNGRPRLHQSLFRSPSGFRAGVSFYYNLSIRPC